MSWVSVVEPAGRDLRFVLDRADEREAPAVFASNACTIVLSGDPDIASLPSGWASSPVERLHDAYLGDHTRFLPQLRGPFALVVWDARERVLLALRDPMGAHPLFFARAGRRIALSPSADAIVDTPVRTDRVAAAAFVFSRPLPAERTLLSGVSRLQPGHLLEFRSGTVSTTRYWRPPLYPDTAESDEDSLERFEEALRAAVERCFAFDRVGVYLSGGLDSASIAVVAAEVCRCRGLPPPPALMLLYRGHDANEEAVQRTVAEALGMPPLGRAPEELLVAGRGLLASALDLARATPGSPPALVEPMYDRLALIARDEQGCGVVLSGMGGDDWLLPPPFLAADSMRRLDLSSVVQLAWAWWHYWPGFGARELVSKLLWPYGVTPLLRQPAVRAVERAAPAYVRGRRRSRLAASLPDWLAPDPGLHAELVETLSRGTPAVQARDHVTQSRLRLLDHVTPSLILEGLFAVEQRIGIRVPAPLLDPDVISVIASMPPVRLVAHGRAKALAAELAGSRVPRFARRWPPTVYGDSLWARTLALEGPAAWSEMGGMEMLAGAGVVDRHLLADKLQRGDHPWSSVDSIRVIRALILEMWLRGRMLRGRVLST
jgi:Asparagine synthase/Glutamine amidotransferase domain